MNRTIALLILLTGALSSVNAQSLSSFNDGNLNGNGASEQSLSASNGSFNGASEQLIPEKEQTFTLSSPNGKQSVTLKISETPQGATRIQYSTSFEGRSVTLPSQLDLQFDNHDWEHALAKFYPATERWCDGLKFESISHHSRDSQWHNPYGERSTVRDAYNGATLHFEKTDGSLYSLDIELRAYDEGIAFRYSLPKHPNTLYHRLLADNSEFAFPEGTMAYFTSWAQGPYSLQSLNSKWDDISERPLTLKISDDLWAAVGEAAVVDFPMMRLSLSKPGTIKAQLNDNSTDLVTPYAMPWRVVMAARSAGELLQNNDIFLNLNTPSQIANESWVRPGKIIRETRMNTAHAFSVIDFAAAHNMQYILFDAGWYGTHDDFTSDPTKVIERLDMQAVCSYAKSKGIGVWVYVNQHALQTQAEKFFPVFKQWGIVGVKFGFVQFTSQHWSEWLHRTVRLAADNDLMVNIHDEYRPTGYSRTYPNLLTQEGIRGNEEFSSASHNTILPFTRMLSGAGDYTVCYFDPRIVNTHAHQLTLPVIFFSPLQTLYWYDFPERIVEVPELEFFDNIPATWDDTRVLSDSIGSHISIARRSGSEWFAAVMGGNEAVSCSIPTDFLSEGESYVLRVYTDDPTITDSPTKVRCSRYIIKGGATLNFKLLERGGAAMHILPAGKEDIKAYKPLKPKHIL